jgi:hypothetical protein
MSINSINPNQNANAHANPNAPAEQERLQQARASFSGRLLSNPQFDEAVTITRILEREILRSGAFKEKLADYAHAYARTENFDTAKAETILRDLFRSSTGRSMNQLREELVAREEALPQEAGQQALEHALGVGAMIETGDKITFHRAFAHQGEALARSLGITDAAAKRLMREEFQAAEQADLYEWGKHLEEEFYRPQIEAERAEAEARRQENGASGTSRSRTARRTRQGNGDNASAGSAGESTTRSSYTRAARDTVSGDGMKQDSDGPPPRYQRRSRMSYDR